MLLPRQQNLTRTTPTVQTYWGYCPRTLPCTSDAASCAYYDSLYRSQSLSTWFSITLWAVIASIVYLWAFIRLYAPSRRIPTAVNNPGEEPKTQKPRLYRLCRSISATSRHYLLPDIVLPIFRQATRRHVLVLSILIAYLTVFTFAGMTYQIWTTPVPNNPGVYNTRTGLAPWADRIGVFAFALTPLSVLLSTRESLLSLLTGISYQSFTFLHRYLGYIIFLQSLLHSISWTIIKARLYQPQPLTWHTFTAQPQYIFGVLGMCAITLLVTLSTPFAIRRTGYDSFRRAHWLLALLYIVACWAHWSKLSAWMISSLVVLGLDHLIRFARMIALHRSSTLAIGFHCPRAQSTLFTDEANGDVVRLDFEHDHDSWTVGQHFYLRFPALRVAQSHPFTPGSLPNTTDGKTYKQQRHTYIIRAKNGETRLLAELARRNASTREKAATTPVILMGPYGRSIVTPLKDGGDVNVLCIAGGTGVTFVLPVLQMLIKESDAVKSRMVEFVWIVRRRSEIEWIEAELDELDAARVRINLTIRIFVTSEDDDAYHFMQCRSVAHPVKSLSRCRSRGFSFTSSNDKLDTIAGTLSIPQGRSHSHTSSPSPSSSSAAAPPPTAPRRTSYRPHLPTIVNGFIASTISGPSVIYASGPGSMMSNIRVAVAAANDGGKVWRGDERGDVRLVGDDRGDG